MVKVQVKSIYKTSQAKITAKARMVSCRCHHLVSQHTTQKMVSYPCVFRIFPWVRFIHVFNLKYMKNVIINFELILQIKLIVKNKRIGNICFGTFHYTHRLIGILMHVMEIKPIKVLIRHNQLIQIHQEVSELKFKLRV